MRLGDMGVTLVKTTNVEYIYDKPARTVNTAL